MTSSSPTVLSLTSSLLTTLTTTLSPTSTQQQQHPFSPLSQPQLTSLQSTLSSTLSQLRSVSQSFQENVLDSTLGGAGGTKAKAALEKYVILLKERASSESILLSLKSDQIISQSLFDKRGHLIDSIPILPTLFLSTTSSSSMTKEERILSLLTQIGTSLSLSSFKDTSPTSTSSILSYIGKLMVLDIEIDSLTGSIKRVKFSYAISSSSGGQIQKDDEDLASRILDLLRGVENVGEEEVEVEERLREFRRILRELKELDEWTSELQQQEEERMGVVDEGGEGGGGAGKGKWDCFEAIKRLRDGLKTYLSTSTTNATTPPSFHPSSQTPYPQIIYYIPPIQLLSPSPSSSKSRSRSFKIQLVNPKDYLPTFSSSSMSIPSSYLPPSPSSNSQPLPPSTPLFQAIFDPPVIIGKKTGRRLLRILDSEREREMEREGMEGVDGVDEDEDGEEEEEEEGKEKGEGEIEWLDELLSIDPLSTYLIDPSPPKTPYYLTLSPNSSKGFRGFKCSHVRFRDPKKLLEVVEVLRKQTEWNEFVKSGFREEIKVLGLGGGGGGGGTVKLKKGGLGAEMGGKKKRKLNSSSSKDVPTTLEALFASPPTSIPLSLTLHPSSLSLSLIFPSSKTSSPLTLTISFYPSSSVEFSEELERLLGEGAREKAGEVVKRTGDLEAVMRWLEKSLEKAEKAKGDQEMS